MSKLQVETISHTNNTTAMTIDSSGRVLTPARPAFQASIASNAWGTLNTGDIVPFNDVTNNNNFDIGSNFNTSSYRFTAPIAGKYLFHAIIYSFNSDSVNGFKFWKNGSLLLGSTSGAYEFTSGQSGSVDATIPITFNANLSSSDYIDIRASTGSDYYGTLSNFGGFLIG
tara:strand:- start:712 stop:1221 length:510 start_codon:yes stop_codon:yes gene_type:complete